MSDEDNAGFGIVPRYLRGKLNAHELAVYLALSWRADQAGESWPSHATLATEAGCSVKSVQRALLTLAGKGVVTWRKRRGDDGGATSNVYRLVVYTQPELPDDPSATEADPLGHRGRPPRPQRPTNENQGTRTKERVLLRRLTPTRRDPRSRSFARGSPT